MSEIETTPARTPVHPVLWVMIAVMIGFEVMFSAAEAGLIGESFRRWPVYRQFAFLDIIIDHGQISRLYQQSAIELLYAPAGLEAIWTFVTYAFLHGGWLHLALNGAAFLGLGHALVLTVGIWRFLVIFVVTAIAGALAFWQITHSPYPMVGASGAIFGLLAVLTAWQERALRHAGLSRAVIWKRIAGLVALNVALAFGLGGLLAWEAHLGGWVAGWLLAGAFRPRHGSLRIL